MNFSNKKWLFLVIIFLLLLNVFVLYKYSVNRENYKKSLSSIELTVKDQQISYEKNFRLNLNNSGENLDKIILKDISNKEISISDLLQNKNQLLVCRISELYCDECVAYSIVKLLNAKKAIDKSNIVFLCTYPNSNSMRHIKEQYDIQDISMFRVSGLNISADDIGFPYYFIIDKTLSISNLFMPEKRAPDLVNKYLDAIYERYFKTDNTSNH